MATLGAVVVLNMEGYPEGMSGVWLNPVNNETSEITKPVIPSDQVEFLRPIGWEDALLVLKIK